MYSSNCSKECMYLDIQEQDDEALTLPEEQITLPEVVFDHPTGLCICHRKCI